MTANNEIVDGVDYSETTWNEYRKCWTDEHGAKVSPPPKKVLLQRKKLNHE
ncbi:MAG TPA: hypothetical protein VEP90_26330 [Methylomirabilota bacterium]|nr:hypothetical protein [Methylomirabilota bacterium]